MLDKITNLDDLWAYCDELHAQFYPDDSLLPIMGNGKTLNPEYMFVFINPTYRNVTSSKEWGGFRAPWIGTKYIWKIFNRAGHFDAELLDEIQNKKEWDTPFGEKVYKHLADRGFYFTNLVKWTGENADLPNKEKINTFLPLLRHEIGLVRPKKIVTFGLMPFESLTGEKLKLGDYYNDLLESGVPTTYDVEFGGHKTEVIPCYFPVCRGDPKRAVEILKLI